MILAACALIVNFRAIVSCGLEWVPDARASACIALRWEALYDLASEARCFARGASHRCTTVLAQHDAVGNCGAADYSESARSADLHLHGQRSDVTVAGRNVCSMAQYARSLHAGMQLQS
mmetsp:Transcript_33742/g.62974  ORF Transcript_33742/g.62974 Transcript_33742/m.62974 type:complete len:119 (-) Transcript_33742:10-366(-)